MYNTNVSDHRIKVLIKVLPWIKQSPIPLTKTCEMNWRKETICMDLWIWRDSVLRNVSCHISWQDLLPYVPPTCMHYRRRSRAVILPKGGCITWSVNNCGIPSLTRKTMEVDASSLKYWYKQVQMCVRESELCFACIVGIKCPHKANKTWNHPHRSNQHSTQGKQLTKHNKIGLEMQKCFCSWA